MKAKEVRELSVEEIKTKLMTPARLMNLRFRW